MKHARLDQDARMVGFEIGKTSPTSVDAPALREQKLQERQAVMDERVGRMMSGGSAPRTPAEKAESVVWEKKWSDRPKRDY